MTGFRGSKIVSDSLVLVFMTPTKVKRNKPLHIGATILEHSKSRECVRAGAAGSRTRRSLGHHLLNPLILRLLVLCAPADLEAQSSLL